ncbi:MULTISPECIES: phage tail assembly protein [unclassified Novosphingobium]|uniref:phage tail assembly protein n=1 Tax=unclassified Novosphingobium TaxID=2644732 RepID=UPI00086FA572|nr:MULTISPECIES: phage tail assembly protein [unclassified Novosphingobium]MBN9143757.1 phage tail assembly protein [Novosphingobium sp.]ODU84367.1 MAG: hypothetical protein ABT10_03000 [Novosphingobium sp. SCN 63-17]OJX92907.1 MAG: hypothetical protein BGP00_23600 [Novosphingobium sp. 63-713]
MAKATDDIPEQLVITLRKPVTLGDITYTELRLREPTVGEMIELGADEGWKADAKAIALISGVPEPAVRSLGVRDGKQASGYLARFLIDAPSTGAAD